MTGLLHRPNDTHLRSKVDPLRKRTEVLVHLLVRGDIWMPQDERSESGRRFQHSDQTLLLLRRQHVHILIVLQNLFVIATAVSPGLLPPLSMSSAAARRL